VRSERNCKLYSEQQIQQSATAADGGKVFLGRHLPSFGVDFATLAVEFIFFHLAGAIEAASADEFDDAAKFFTIKPHAVGAANVEDDAGAAGELGGSHDLSALGTGDVGASSLIFLVRHGRGRAKDGGLILAIGADLLKSRRINPDAAALFAVVELDVAEVDIFERNSTERAVQIGGGNGGWRCEGVPAVRAESGADKCQAEA